MARRSSSGGGGAMAILVILGVVGACSQIVDGIVDDPKPPSSPAAEAVFVGSIVAVTGSELTVQVGADKVRTRWARLNHGGMCGAEIAPALDARLHELLPLGLSVTIVREPVRSAPPGKSDYVYVHLAAPGAVASVQPYGVSINEQVVAEGNSVTSPEINRDDLAPPSALQVEAVRAEVPAAYLAAFDGIINAGNQAWSNRVGAIGLCRDRLDREHARLVELWGPDGRIGTDDDPDRDWTPSVNSGGGGGGGGGESRFCRKRWWC